MAFPLIVTVFGLLAGCGDKADLSMKQGTGPNPVLPEPSKTLIPTVNVLEARGWGEGEHPEAAKGFSVKAFSVGLNHPRWLYRLPNGDILVAETNGPEEKNGFSIRGWVMGKVMEHAGAGMKSPDRIILLRDKDGDGVAETRNTFLQGLHSPFGMALVGKDLYVANTDAIMRFPYEEGETSISAAGEKVADLPANPPDYHWSKSLVASPDGKKLYVGVGSNSNYGEDGMQNEQNRAAILEFDIGTRTLQPFATGLRNPVGMDWQPQTGQLWVVVNERDELGSDLVPDYLTSVKQGAFYGWPYSYYGQHVDTRVEPQKPELVAKAIAPDYALGPHVAALGLTFYQGKLLPERYRGGAFIGLHGSWNRKPLSGYKVIFVPFANGKPSGEPEDILTGFINSEWEVAYGRPVGVIEDKAGALLVADDVGNTIWRLTPSAAP
ncbi:MAG TPA: sorbosone dehydrogenase family protein [Methylophilaceae bacterium]|nr:sorbosone dehydrogenase family protein [Methylophilaceae bacterium]